MRTSTVARAASIASIVSVLALGALWSGCFSPLHVPPKAGRPAATVKFRINHVPSPTGMLAFGLLIDGHRVDHRPPRRGPSATWTRVKPGWRNLKLRSAFYYRQAYQQTYTHRTSYRCGNRTCYRSQIRRRTAYRNVYTGVCARQLAVYMRQGQTYLLSYSYLGNKSCSLGCHRQMHTKDGRFHLSPCQHTKAYTGD